MTTHPPGKEPPSVHHTLALTHYQDVLPYYGAIDREGIAHIIHEHWQRLSVH